MTAHIRPARSTTFAWPFSAPTPAVRGQQQSSTGDVCLPQLAADLIYKFIPKKNNGSKYPKHENVLCFGKNLTKAERLNKFNLSFILDAFSETSGKNVFFNNYFIKLAGTKDLQAQIINGFTENQIIQSWQKKLDIYKKMRMKYLVY